MGSSTKPLDAGRPPWKENVLARPAILLALPLLLMAADFSPAQAAP